MGFVQRGRRRHPDLHQDAGNAGLGAGLRAAARARAPAQRGARAGVLGAAGRLPADRSRAGVPGRVLVRVGHRRRRRRGAFGAVGAAGAVRGGGLLCGLVTDRLADAQRLARLGLRVLAEDRSERLVEVVVRGARLGEHAEAEAREALGVGETAGDEATEEPAAAKPAPRKPAAREPKPAPVSYTHLTLP